MKRKSYILLLILCCLTCFGPHYYGCAARNPDYFAYRDRDFHATARGKLADLDFCAQIWVKGREGGHEVTVEYLSPSRFQGLRLRALTDANGEIRGKASIDFRGIVTEASADTVRGLLSPASALLCPADFLRVKVEGEGYVITLSEDTRLSLSSDGIPLSYHAPRLSFEIAQWEDESASSRVLDRS